MIPLSAGARRRVDEEDRREKAGRLLPLVDSPRCCSSWMMRRFFCRNIYPFIHSFIHWFINAAMYGLPERKSTISSSQRRTHVHINCNNLPPDRKVNFFHIDPNKFCFNLDMEQAKDSFCNKCGCGQVREWKLLSDV